MKTMTTTKTLLGVNSCKSLKSMSRTNDDNAKQTPETLSQDGTNVQGPEARRKQGRKQQAGSKQATKGPSPNAPKEGVKGKGGRPGGLELMGTAARARSGSGFSLH